MSTLDCQGQVAELVAKARAAQQILDGYSQEQVDELVTAVAWALINPAHNQPLAELAVAETGMGNVPDKVTKNHRKTLGLLRDLREAKTVGVINEIPELGLVEIARPVGVVGAIVPSTNPIATPMNKTLNALKCRNAIILSPSPKGQPSCTRLLKLMHAEMDKIGAPRDLVQQLPAPVSKELSMELLRQVDLVVVTGSQRNVKNAYTCGTPAFGVGAGNVVSIVDESADLAAAASKIKASKTFDNATSCSSENSVIIVDSVYQQMLQAFADVNACLLDAGDKQRLQDALWPEGKLNGTLLAKPVAQVAEAAGLANPQAPGSDFMLVEETGVGADYPYSGEKMSLVLTVYRVADFAAAEALAAKILDYQGKGHSVSLHTQQQERGEHLGNSLPVCRIIVNQPHCFATGGSFDNGMPFSLSMGCGTWGGNVTDQNVGYRQYMNITRVVRTIAPREPSVDELFGAYLAKVGQ